jgi:hypothetical protein
VAKKAPTDVPKAVIAKVLQAAAYKIFFTYDILYII